MMLKEIRIQEEYIKLDQLLKLSGIADTGGHAKMMVIDGNVKVNGITIIQRGKKIRPDDIVTVNENIQVKVIR